MTEFEKGYEQGYKDGIAGAALPNVNDNGDKIDGYSYAYKTDSNGEPYIHIDSVRSMLKKAADVQPVKHGRWVQYNRNGEETYIECTNCCVPSRPRHLQMVTRSGEGLPDYCPNCGADMREKV